MARLVFLTETGRPLVRQNLLTPTNDGVPQLGANIDRLTHQFNSHLKKLGLKHGGIGFYALRHTFRTIADETADQHAIFRIMGHALPGMSGVYVEQIRIERLRAAVDHIRSKVMASNQ